MKTKSQKEIIKEQLRANGYVSRNWALDNFISRLGAIIADLKKEGFVFNASYNEGNYEYHLAHAPKRQVQDVKIIDGKAVISYHEEEKI